MMRRSHGLSISLKFTLGYFLFLAFGGALLLVVIWLFLLRYVPDGNLGLISGHIPNRSDLWRAFSPHAARALIFLLLLALIGGWLIARTMLAPLKRITAVTDAVAKGDLSRRINLPGRSNELSKLADAFDGMLDQLQAHVDEQRRFAANASHELRTPLAITQTLLSVAQQQSEPPSRELLEKLGVLNTRAIDLTESLLLLARADARAFEREELDLSLLAEEATETMLPLIEERNITLDFDSQPAPTYGNFALLLQLVSTLLHNAIVHNGGPDQHIWIRTSINGDSVSLCVENTGAPVPAGTLRTLLEPFQRGAARRHDTERAGVGLGLAIAQSITRAHAGKLELTARDTGGLRAMVTLPRGARTA
ncbi:sensor histidine kinase [Glutamicibacter sp. X7]